MYDIPRILDICALGALEHRLILTLSPQGAPDDHAALAAAVQDLVDRGALIDCGAGPEGRVLKTAAAVFAGGPGRDAA